MNEGHTNRLGWLETGISPGRRPNVWAVLQTLNIKLNLASGRTGMNIWKVNLTIGTKLVSGFLAVALLVAIVGYIGTRTASNMRQRFELSTAVDAVLVKSLDREAAVS